MTCMQIINQHFRNATNRSLAFFRFTLEFRLIRIDPNFRRRIQIMISDCQKKKDMARVTFDQTALTIPVIDKQYAFTQYLSASSAYALGLKLAPSPLAVSHYWKILARQRICVKQSIFTFKESPTRFVHRIVELYEAKEVNPTERKRPRSLSRVAVVAGQ